MSTQNTAAILSMLQRKNVTAVRTPAGVVFMGVRNLTEGEKKTISAIPQSELQAALRWQK